MADAKTQTGSSDAQNANQVKKKISLVKIIILLLILLVVFGGAAAGVLFFLYDSESSDAAVEPEADKPKEDDPPPPEDGAEDAGTVELKPFIVNLMGGSYLKVSIALGFGAVEHQAILEGKSVQVRDAILTVLSSKSAKTLSTKHGQMKLKGDIKKSLGKLTDLKNIVTSVYFTEFQIL